MNEWRGIKSRVISTICVFNVRFKGVFKAIPSLQRFFLENNSSVSTSPPEGTNLALYDKGILKGRYSIQKIMDFFSPLRLKERNYNYSKCSTLPLEDAVFLPPPFFLSTNPKGWKPRRRPSLFLSIPLFPPRQPGERQRVPNSHRENHPRQRSRRWWCVWPSSRIIWLSFQKWDRWGRRETGIWWRISFWKGMEIGVLRIRVLFVVQ